MVKLLKVRSMRVSFGKVVLEWFAKLFLLLLLFFHVDGRVEIWESCGGEPPSCYCQNPDPTSKSVFGCHPFSDLRRFPEAGVCWHLHFFKSPITEIQPFDEAQWPSLKRLDVIDTDNLTCGAIAAVQRPGLRIYSHCIDCSAGAAEAPKASVVNLPLLITLYCLVVFCMFVVGCGIYYCRKWGWEEVCGGGHGNLSRKGKHEVWCKATSPL